MVIERAEVSSSPEDVGGGVIWIAGGGGLAVGLPVGISGISTSAGCLAGNGVALPLLFPPSAWTWTPSWKPISPRLEGSGPASARGSSGRVDELEGFDVEAVDAIRKGRTSQKMEDLRRARDL